VLGRPLDRPALAHAAQVVRRSGGIAVALSRLHQHVTEATSGFDGLPATAGLDELVRGIGAQAWREVDEQPTINISP
jgi:hypothetical protein